MTETECLARMIAPGTRRPSKPYFDGVIQVHVTRACDKACFGCTQNSQGAGRVEFIPIDKFRDALKSLQGYFGVVGVFGGNPATHPKFIELCAVVRELVPFERRGLWCNNPITLEKAKAAAETFNPAVSNLNVHLDRKAFDLFKEGWPASRPFGLDKDSRHSPTLVAMKDVLKTACDECSGNGGWYTSLEGHRHLSDPDSEFQNWQKCLECDGQGQVPHSSKIYELISTCDINQHWSAMIGMFRGELRAWFCEVAGAQSILHQDEEDYPDTGKRVVPEAADPAYKGLPWWQLSMQIFAGQVRKHCFECGVPLRRRGELAMSTDPVSKEEVTESHIDAFHPKRKDRLVELVVVDNGPHVQRSTNYLGNA